MLKEKGMKISILISVLFLVTISLSCKSYVNQIELNGLSHITYRFYVTPDYVALGKNDDLLFIK